MATEEKSETLDISVTDPSRTEEARRDRRLAGTTDWVVFGVTSIAAL
ncbi:hypothetical protein HTV45_33535, partial [Streptomyces sp. CHD11]|nr:hypothetical protein [Streptomyces sp. CHD11]